MFHKSVTTRSLDRAVDQGAWSGAKSQENERKKECLYVCSFSQTDTSMLCQEIKYLRSISWIKAFTETGIGRFLSSDCPSHSKILFRLMLTNLPSNWDEPEDTDKAGFPKVK